MGVDPVQRERDDAAAIVARGRPEDGEAWYLCDPLERVRGEVGLGGVNGGKTELIDPANRRPEPDRLAYRRRPALELGGQVGPGDQLLGDLADHRAAADEGRHLLEQLTPAEERADAGRAVQLVRGERIEVGAE